MMNNPLITLLQMGNNPQMIMQNVMNNPQMRPVMQQFNIASNQMRQNNMNCKQYVEQYCRQNNIDVRSITQILSNFGIKL